jgi:DNA-binding GntR family transcriptional regulator
MQTRSSRSSRRRTKPSAVRSVRPETLHELAVATRLSRAITPELIAETIREAIAPGILEQRAPLRQKDIVADFAVSSIPVREALRRLEALGFIELAPNRGFIVSRVSIDEIREMFDMRVALEPLLIRLAVPKRATEDLTAARQVLQELDDESDSMRWGELNWRFHSRLYAAAARSRTLSTLANLHAQVDQILRLQMSLVDAQRTSRREHLAILAVCKEGDAELAADLLIEHIKVVGDTIVGFAKGPDAGHRSDGRARARPRPARDARSKPTHSGVRYGG